MHSSTLLASVLAVGALALPQGQLEKRQAATQTVTVTVTVSVFVNPYATPAWTAPHFSQTPNTRRPTNAPPLWTPPHIDDPKTRSTVAPIVNPIRTSTSSSTTRTSTSSSTTRSAASVPSLSSSTRTSTTPANTPPTVGPINGQSSSTPTGVRTSSTIGSAIGSAISQAPASTPIGTSSSSVTAPVPTGTAVGPAHITGTAQASLSTGTDYQNAILFHHNEARANHGAQPLVWDDAVAQTAAQAANTCNFAHYIPAGAGQGQNLFTTSGNFFNVTAGITESWYKGEFQAMLPYFGMADIPDDVFHNVGHLTQVLWKGTTRVGCVSIDCGTRMIVGGVSGSPLNKYTVCNYAPAGNVAGQYAINVGLPISTTNLGSWTD